MIGTITLAQFQDNNQRSRLRTLLARFQPTEVLLEHERFSQETEGVLRLIAPKAAKEFLRGKEMPPPLDALNIVRKSQYFGKPSSSEKILY